MRPVTSLPPVPAMPRSAGRCGCARTGGTAECVLVAHQTGVELRITVDGEMMFSRVFASPTLARESAAHHRGDFVILGWEYRRSLSRFANAAGAARSRV